MARKKDQSQDPAGGGRRPPRYAAPNWEEGQGNMAVERIKGRLSEGGEGAPESGAPEGRKRQGSGDQAGTHRAYGRQARINPQTGREEIRDGKWWVDAEALAPYGYDPDSAPPELVEANRVGIAQSARQNTLRRAAAYADEAWQPYTANLGYANWRDARREAIREAERRGIQDMQHVWQGGPGLWEELGLLSKSGQQQPPPSGGPQPPGPPMTPPPAPGQRPTQVINGILYQQQEDGTWTAMGPAPGAPPPGGTPPQTEPPTTQPPVNQGTKMSNPVGGLSDTIKQPPMGPVAQPPTQMKNPMQTSVSSYVGAPKPGNFGSSSQFRLPSLKPSGGGLGGMQLPKLGGNSGKMGGF